MQSPGPEADRRNLRTFSASYVLIYFAAPITYVGVVQASLCHRLGASAAVSNIPAGGYLLPYLIPLVATSLIPYRAEKNAAAVSSLFTAAMSGLVCLTLFLPLSNTGRLVAVIAHAIAIGFSESIGSVYRYQCLARGTTDLARARTLKIAFTIGPISAVLGSLTTQFILGDSLRFLPYPYDFGCIYLIGMLCMLGVAWLSTSYEMAPIEEERRPALHRHLARQIRDFVANPVLLALGLGFLFWNLAFNAIPNLALYASKVTALPESSGLIMALRFAGKSMGGFALGAIAARFGFRVPLLMVVALVGISLLWGWLVPGYLFFLAFLFIGAGELGTPYFNNYVLAVSPSSKGAQNLAILSLASGLSGLGPIGYGAIADRAGFGTSFGVALGMALIALCLVFRLPVLAVSRAGTNSIA